MKNHISRVDLEALPTEELLRIRALTNKILKDRIDQMLTLIKPRAQAITLIKLVRETLGVGLKEAKDLVEAEATIELPETPAGERLKAMVAMLALEKRS